MKRQFYSPKNDRFVPDPRCSGWWAVVVLEQITPNGPQSIYCTEFRRKASVNSYDVQKLLKAYCRYRVYASTSGNMVLSVREENVDHVCDALVFFILERPTADHLQSSIILSERAPFLLEFSDELKQLIHNFEFKKVLASTNMQPKAVIKRNYVSDLVEVIIKRIVIDYPTQKDQDNLFQRISAQVVGIPCQCVADCSWKRFKSTWEFRELFYEKLGKNKEETKKTFEKFSSMTKEQFDRRMAEDADTFANELRQNISETTDSPTLEVRNEVTDNEPVTSEDLRSGRGLFLSSSNTYLDWQGGAWTEEELGNGRLQLTATLTVELETSPSDQEVHHVTTSANLNFIR
uniref:SPK domain-containing protein n=1 Tax=Caenorhabditis tropicalis TaxID=1561998 RepID=A0A1I7U0I5_9PELO